MRSLFFASDEVDYFRSNLSPAKSTSVRVGSADGTLFARLDSFEFDAKGLAEYLKNGPFPANGWGYSSQVQPQSLGSFLGFQLIAVHGSNGPHITYTDRVASLPDWLLAAVFAILPLRFAARRRRIFPSWCCQHCGYDLRATPDRCPECGTAVDSSRSQSERR
jgi:hypothetical protein